MENKGKAREHGITLVALVITIIILLILAGVAITALTQTGLFEKAKEAKNAMENAQENENFILGDYENKIQGGIVGGVRENLKEQTPGTAMAEDITEGKTAWVNGEMITGTMKKENYKLLSWSSSFGSGHGITDKTNTIIDAIENNKSIEVVCSGNVGSWVTYYLMIDGNTVDTITDNDLHIYDLKEYSSNSNVQIRITTNGTFVGAGYAIKINEY